MFPRRKKAVKMSQIFFSEFLFKKIEGSGWGCLCQSRKQLMLSWPPLCPVHSSIPLLMHWSYCFIIFSFKVNILQRLFLSLAHNTCLIYVWMNEWVMEWMALNVLWYLVIWMCEIIVLVKKYFFVILNSFPSYIPVENLIQHNVLESAIG